MTNAEKFLQEMNENEKIREFIGRRTPIEGKTKEEALVSFAKECGFDFSEEELIAAVKARKEKLEAAEKNAEEAIETMSSGELDAVNGGADSLCLGDYAKCSDCKDSYKKGEWCWFTDSCSDVIQKY